MLIMASNRASSALRRGLFLRESLQRQFSQGAVPPKNVNLAASYSASAKPQLKSTFSDEEPWRFPLSEPVPGFSSSVKSTANDAAEPFAARITTLDNGLKVASEPNFGEFCTIGVVIDGGSRYEVAYPSGICHFLEKLAFNSTVSNPSRDDISAILDRHGGICDAQCTKDTFIYAASCHKSGLDEVLGAIADAVHRPVITEEEHMMAREIVNFEVENLHARPEVDPILTDLIHAAAYRDNTLGLPKICPPENTAKISREMLFSYLKTYFVPERMVIAGVGIEHEKLVQTARKHFQEKSPVWESNPSLLVSSVPEADQSTSQYTGGHIRIDRDLSIFNYGPSPFPNLTHFMLGLESCGYKDADFVPFCVLNTLMGGGGSFSAGGPGKGMYTRLYLDVLNRHHWLYNATSYNHTYSDSGLFCIHASADPRKMRNTVEIITNAFVNMYNQEVKSEELERAKKQLQSMLMMNLEQRPVMFEDLGRQVLGHGRRKSPLEYMEEIKAVTAEDITRIAERMLSSKPAVVGYGDLSSMPSFDSIDTAIANSASKKSRFSLFK